jgi:probable F420-dependent oxidoreductase
MKFTQVMALIDMEELPPLAQRAEAVGFEALALGEHFVTFGKQYEVYDYSNDGAVLWYPETHWPDPWVMFGALSQVTRKIRFITTVCVLPMHDVFALTKSIITAARLSHNRVTFGAGVGWQQTEFELVHQSFHTRGRRTDEMLELMALLMRGEMVSYQGEFYRFEPLQMSPGVTERVPVLIGGASPAALRRAARHDGWIGGALVDMDGIAEVIASLRRERLALGKSLSDPFEIQLSLKSYTPEIIKRLEDMGVTQIHKDAWLDENGRASRMTLQEKLNVMDEFADKFIR